MENCKRRLVSCAEEDRISNLPEHLIDSVLERLPVEDSVRTSILSKTWWYKWTKLRSMVFDKHFTNKFAKNGAFGRNGFIRIINQALFFHEGPILKFHLHLPRIALDSFQEIDQWILLLSRNGVMELVLTNSNRCYKLPLYVFSCLQLTKLELDNCYFKQPLGFEGFPNLEDLKLWNIDFGANLCGTQINLPQLEKLLLHSCTNVYNFNLKATKLQSLNVYSCPDAVLLRLLDSPGLIKVGIIFWKSKLDSAQVEKMNLATLWSNLPRFRHFCIDSHFLKFLAAEKIPKLLPRAITSLKHLRLQNIQFGDLDQLDGALCLLRNSPNLEFLTIIIHFEMGPQVDVGPASKYLESPNCLDCTLNQLQTLEIRSLEGSKLELLLIELLLAHSPSLKKFTITPSKTCDAKNILNIAKDVMRFPRASTKAQVIYLDP